MWVGPEVWKSAPQFFLELAVQGIIEVFLSARRSGGLEKWNTYAGTLYTVCGGVPDVRWSQVRVSPCGAT